MEVSLPRSTVRELAKRSAAGGPALAATPRRAKTAAAGSSITTAPQAANAPSVSLPLRFMLTGLGSLLAAVGWLVWRPDVLATYHYNQTVIALTHLLVLGFIGSVVMGAMYQLVPVALETKLFSERLAKVQFVLHVAGFVGMVLMFRVWNMKQVGHFGSVMLVGVGLFVFNIARTLLRAPKWNAVTWAIAAALGWISLTVIAGLSIAAAKCSYQSTTGLATVGGVRMVINGLRSVAGFMAHFDQISAMHAHAHAGVVGFFLMLILGVSYRLVPMFALSELQSQRRAVLSIGLLNLGLAGLVVAILLRSPWKLAFAGVLITGLAVYGWELRAILRARKRAHLDWGLRTFLTALGLVLPLSLLGLVLSWPWLPLSAFTGQLENVYGFVVLFGVVTFAILGMLQKILPFLVWFGVYSPHIGRAQLPLLAEMGSERLQVAGYWSFLAALATTVMATLLANPAGVRTGGGLLALSLALFVLNTAKVLRHFFRPQLQPLAPPATLKKVSA